MKSKRLLLLSALMLLLFNAFSQNLEVTFFEPLPYDMTARSTSGKMDQNGKRCALVRVATTDRSVSFEGGSLGIVATEPKPGEIWVWLPAHSRRITIAHPESEPLYYDFDNIELEEGCTYRLKLKTPKQQENPIVLTQKCALSVKSDKNGDEVYINDSLSGRTPLSIKLSQGASYEVKVKRGNISDTKTVVIDKDDLIKQVEFKFTRTISIKSDKNGDIVFVDGHRQGYSPVIVELPYGEHVIRVERSDGKYDEKNIVVERTGGETDFFLYLYTRQEHFTKESISFATLNFGIGFLDFKDIQYPQRYLQKSYGFTVGYVKKVGGFFTFMTNFNFKAFNPDYVAEYQIYDGEGGDFVDGNYPFYSGESCSSRISVMAGLLVKVGNRGCFRLGAGYGRSAFAYSDVKGNWIRPERFDRKGLDVSLGLQFNNHNHSVFTFDLVSTSFSTIEARVGIGFCEQTKKIINFE